MSRPAAIAVSALVIIYARRSSYRTSRMYVVDRYEVCESLAVFTASVSRIQVCDSICSLHGCIIRGGMCVVDYNYARC